MLDIKYPVKRNNRRTFSTNKYITKETIKEKKGNENHCPFLII
jgi:hypothetical protein